MPSVMITTSSTPACAASSAEAAANGGGTKIIAVLAPLSVTQVPQSPKTGMPSTFSPAFLGLMPPTTFVPYRRLFSVWNEPSRPVMPATASFVFSPTRIDISVAPLRQRDDLLGRPVHR